MSYWNFFDEIKIRNFPKQKINEGPVANKSTTGSTSPKYMFNTKVRWQTANVAKSGNGALKLSKIKEVKEVHLLTD